MWKCALFFFYREIRGIKQEMESTKDDDQEIRQQLLNGRIKDVCVPFGCGSVHEGEAHAESARQFSELCRCIICANPYYDMIFVLVCAKTHITIGGAIFMIPLLPAPWSHVHVRPGNVTTRSDGQ